MVEHVEAMKRDTFSRLSVVIILTIIAFFSTVYADDKASSGLNGNGHLQFEDIPLMQAIAKGDLDLVKKLVDEGASIDVELFNGMKPIHEAAADGKIDIVQYLLESGADVNSKMVNDITPIFIAVESQNLDVAKLLLSKGAKYSGREINLAIIRDNLVFIKLLVNTPALANSYGHNRATLLHAAAMSGKPEIVQYLIDQGANVDAKTADGETPLDMATKNKERLSGLLARGINKEQLLDQGFNYDGYDDVIAILKKHENK